MPRGSSLNQLLGTKLYQCQRTAFENLTCPWKAHVLILPRKMELLGYFSKLEKTSQATRSGETSSYPTLPVKWCQSDQCWPLESCPLLHSWFREEGCLTPRVYPWYNRKVQSQRKRKSDFCEQHSYCSVAKLSQATSLFWSQCPQLYNEKLWTRNRCKDIENRPVVAKGEEWEGSIEISRCHLLYMHDG